MINTEHFWRDILLFVLGLAVVYAILRYTLFKKVKNPKKASDITINSMIALGILFLIYRIFIAIEIPGGGLFLILNAVLGSIVDVCVLALATTGIVLIFKTSTTTNFSQGMIATVAAFTAAKVVAHLASTYADMSAGMVIALAMIIGAMTSFMIGIVIDVFIIRKSKFPSPIGKQMITMGLVLAFTGLIPIVFGTLALAVPKLSYAENLRFTINELPYTVTIHSMYALGITVVLLTLLFSLLRFTKWGLGVRATASNELVASMMGVNTRVITAMSWAIAGLLGGVAAILVAPKSGTLQVAMMVPTQVNGFLAAILGSFSSFAGPLISSILIPILSSVLSIISSTWQNAIVYVIILVIVLVKPSGLFGKQVAKKV